MKEIRKHFPALENMTYLNTPGNGLIPKPVVEWRRTHDMEFLNYPNNWHQKQTAYIEGARKEIARFLHTTTSQIALVPNFSYGLNMVLEGISEKQRVLMLKGDYPSLTWPIHFRGFSIHEMSIDEHLEESIQQAIHQFKPTIFIFSIAQWLSGIRINLDFVKELKSNHPNLLLIGDGTQYINTEEFNFDESGLDVLISSAYKWLTSGFGNGFLIIKENVRDRIHPKVIGLHSAENLESDMNETSYMKCFEPGHLDSINFGTLMKSLAFFQSLSVKECYENIRNLSRLAKEKFLELGVLNRVVQKREIASNFFTISGNNSLFQKLQEENIICVPRGEGIRVGFHYYNNEEDLERLIDVVKKNR